MNSRLPAAAFVVLLLSTTALAGCKKPSEIQGTNFMEAQKKQMDRAKEVGKEMQKAADQRGRTADEESK